MADALTSPVWAYRALFAALALVLIFARLLPLGSVAGAWPGPDLLFLLTLCWVLRRPDFLPVWLVAAVMLFEDLLLMRPPGLWAAVVVLAVEFLRSRVVPSRQLGFLVEWILVAGVIAASMLGYRLALMLAMLPQASLGMTLVQMILSILCYPLVVGASQVGLGVRRPATGAVTAQGRLL